MTYPLPALARQGYDQHRIRSRAVHRWRANEGRIESMTTPTRAAAANQPVFTRAATATGTDVNSGTMTFPFHYPAWTWRNSQPHLSLKDITTPNVLYYPWMRDFGEMSGLIYFNQSGAVPAAGKGFWYIGAASEIGVRMWLESNGTRWRIALNDGSSEEVSNTTVTPADTDTVVIRWELENTSGNLYRVRIHQSINGAAEVSGTASGTLTITSWPAGVRLYYGSLGGQNAAAVELTSDLVAAGQLTLAQLQAIF